MPSISSKERIYLFVFWNNSWLDNLLSTLSDLYNTIQCKYILSEIPRKFIFTEGYASCFAIPQENGPPTQGRRKV